MNSQTAENTPHRIRFNFAITGYVFLFPVILFWTYWFVCFVINPTSEERLIMFYQLIPQRLCGMQANGFMVLLCLTALSLGITEKMIFRKKWYKTEHYIQFLILLSGFMLFINVFQVIF
ncbi:MAG: hypothetical protein NT126_09405 [Bacteroidetes bacterium]|nr:hypothetical protein [Bacteroidota bacterium]